MHTARCTDSNSECFMHLRGQCLSLIHKFIHLYTSSICCLLYFQQEIRLNFLINKLEIYGEGFVCLDFFTTDITSVKIILIGWETQ